MWAIDTLAEIRGPEHTNTSCLIQRKGPICSLCLTSCGSWDLRNIQKAAEEPEIVAKRSVSQSLYFHSLQCHLVANQRKCNPNTLDLFLLFKFKVLLCIYLSDIPSHVNVNTI